MASLIIFFFVYLEVLCSVLLVCFKVHDINATLFSCIIKNNETCIPINLDTERQY